MLTFRITSNTTFLKTLVLIPILFGFSQLTAQSMLIVQPGPDEGKDATVWSVDPDLTQPDYPDVIAAAWTWSGTPGVYRTFFEFDLSPIATGTTISFAYLSLYYNDVSTTNGQEGDNASYIRRVIEDWEEDEVNWINQPAWTEENEVYLEESTSIDQDYENINVTALVQDMIDDPTGSFGFAHVLEVEEHYASMKFCSSDSDEEEKRPKLVIGWNGKTDTIIGDTSTTDTIIIGEIPSLDDYLAVEDCHVYQPGFTQGKDAVIWDIEELNNYGDHTDVIAASWTWGGTSGNYRSLLEFDIDDIPIGATIDSSFLYLYYNETSTTNGQEGENTTLIQRVITPWSEGAVSWETKPGITTVNEVELPESTSIDQDYLHVDVTDMVQDMVDDPDNSHGFMFRQETEAIYSSMKFYSTDALVDSIFMPALVVCYTTPTFINEYLIDKVKVYPQPANDEIRVESGELGIVRITLKDLIGRDLNTVEVNSKFYTMQLPSNITSGEYLITIEFEGGEVGTKLISVQR